MTPGTSKASTVALVVTVAVLLAAVATAWVLDVRTPDDTYTVTVRSADEDLARFDMAALEALGMRVIKAQGQEQEGPTLLSVLRAAGVGEFTHVTIRGAGIRDDGVIELDAEQIDDDVVLDFAERGTAKVAGPSIEWEDRVRDVETIEVR